MLMFSMKDRFAFGFTSSQDRRTYMVADILAVDMATIFKLKLSYIYMQPHTKMQVGQMRGNVLKIMVLLPAS